MQAARAGAFPDVSHRFAKLAIAALGRIGFHAIDHELPDRAREFVGIVAPVLDRNHLILPRRKRRRRRTV